MKNIKELTSEIQDLCVQNISDTEVLKEIYNLLKDIDNRKKEIVENITNLSEDFNKMARQMETIPAEKMAENDNLAFEYYGYQVKRDACRTCAKIIEDL